MGWNLHKSSRHESSRASTFLPIPNTDFPLVRIDYLCRYDPRSSSPIKISTFERANRFLPPNPFTDLHHFSGENLDITLVGEPLYRQSCRPIRIENKSRANLQVSINGKVVCTHDFSTKTGDGVEITNLHPP